MSDSIRIRSCASREEADLLKGLLEVNGIRAMVSADDYIGLPLLISGGVDLLVLKENIEPARQILEASPENGGAAPTGRGGKASHR